jgi:hypothetical protein
MTDFGALAAEAAAAARRAADAAPNPAAGSVAAGDLADEALWEIDGAHENQMALLWNTASVLTASAAQSARSLLVLHHSDPNDMAVSGGVLARACAEAAGLAIHLTDTSVDQRVRVARYLALHINALDHLGNVGISDTAKPQRALLRTAAESWGLELGPKKNLSRYALGNSQAAELGLRIDDREDVRKIAAVARSYISGLAHGMPTAVRLDHPGPTQPGERPSLRLLGMPSDIPLWMAAVATLRAAEALNTWTGNPESLVGIHNRVVTAFNPVVNRQN